MIKLKSYNQNLQSYIKSPCDDVKFNASEYTKDESIPNWVKSDGNVTVIGTFSNDKSKYILLKVNSMDKKKSVEKDYEVLIQFYGDLVNLDKAYIKVLSNSPGWVYRYMALYDRFKLLPDGTSNLDWIVKEMPNKSNPKFIMGYDITVYCGMMFIKDNTKNFDRYRKYSSLDELLKKIRPFKKIVKMIDKYDNASTIKEAPKPSKERVITSTAKNMDIKKNQGNRIIKPLQKHPKIQKVSRTR